MSSGMILTNTGRAMLAQALSGHTLTFTRAMTGDGTLGTRDARTLTALISSKRELPIQSISAITSTGTCEIVLEMTNKGLKQGFFVREYGVYAKIDNGSEALYSYCNKGNEAGYLEGENGIDLINYTLSLVTVIDQAANVTAYITNSNQYVTISRLESRVQDLYGSNAPISGFWTYNPDKDDRIRPSSADSVREFLLGTNDIQSLVSRVERLEDAMSQTLLELEMQNIFPGYSHYIIEDFKEVNQIDQFEGKVLGVVAGDDSIDVDPVDGMYPGSWYTITDGINSEQVQVDTINLENDIQRVILKDVIKNTYYLDNTRIFRTSATVGEGLAQGAQARRIQTWAPDRVFKGQGASTDYTVAMSFDVNAEKNFTFNGAATLGSGNVITLNN